MPRGRKPKPTALHALHGDPSHLRGKVATRQKMEPAEPSTLEPPDDFTAEQRAEWDEAIAHAPPGILRRIDAGALRVWVIASDLHRQARKELAIGGLLVEGKPSGYLSILNRQAALMLRAAEQLGFTPVSRPRLANAPMPLPDAVPIRTARADMALEEYLSGRPGIPSLH
jgi:phage terminase small subunit